MTTEYMSDNQSENTHDLLEQEKEKQSKVAPLLPYMWKKGQSGNPAGRPKGKTMKEYVKEWLERMSDEERDAFLEGIPKHEIWKMAEGNPDNKTDLTSKGEQIVFIPSEIANKNDIATNQSTS